jgi:hypothetical protein
MMISEEARDKIADALEQRRLMLEERLVTAPPDCRAQIAADIEACRSLLKVISTQTKSAKERARAEKAFFGVEGEIRNLRHMASITTGLINDIEIGAETASTIELRISLEEFEQIQFAVGQTYALAKELVEAFDKEFT